MMLGGRWRGGAMRASASAAASARSSWLAATVRSTSASFSTRNKRVPSTRNEDGEAVNKQLVKRKVAIVAGYSGTGYHGVQLNDNVQTIEHELRQAIFNAGAMRESNFEDLGKIDWSRSSRTDKGVHAGCIVVRNSSSPAVHNGNLLLLRY